MGLLPAAPADPGTRHCCAGTNARVSVDHNGACTETIAPRPERRSCATPAVPRVGGNVSWPDSAPPDYHAGRRDRPANIWQPATWSLLLMSGSAPRPMWCCRSQSLQQSRQRRSLSWWSGRPRLPTLVPVTRQRVAPDARASCLWRDAGRTGATPEQSCFRPGTGIFGAIRVRWRLRTAANPLERSQSRRSSRKSSHASSATADPGGAGSAGEVGRRPAGDRYPYRLVQNHVGGRAFCLLTLTLCHG